MRYDKYNRLNQGWSLSKLVVFFKNCNKKETYCEKK